VRARSIDGETRNRRGRRRSPALRRVRPARHHRGGEASASASAGPEGGVGRD